MNDLARRAARLARASAARRDDANVMLVRVASETYAVLLGQLIGIHRAELTPVPLTARYVAGLMNVRGELVAVLRADTLLGSAARQDLDGEVLLSSYQGQMVGLLVDQALGLHALEPAQLRPALSGAAYAHGTNSEGVTWIDLPGLFSQLPAVWHIEGT